MFVITGVAGFGAGFTGSTLAVAATYLTTFSTFGSTVGFGADFTGSTLAETFWITFSAFGSIAGFS